jgi:hypothetical protein
MDGLKARFKKERFYFLSKVPGRSMSCWAGEKTRRWTSKTLTTEVSPDEANIIVMTANW